jgi:hypothetical protein
VCVCVCGLSEVAENKGIAFAVVGAGRQRVLQLQLQLRGVSVCCSLLVP